MQKNRSKTMYATTAARTLIAQRWKIEELPTIEEWRAKLMDYAELARLTGEIQNQIDQKF